MKIIEKVLKNKLRDLGYDENMISEKLDQFDFDIIDQQIINEKDAEDYINIREFRVPTVEIARTLINFNKYYLKTTVVDGNVNISTATTSIGINLPTVDYRLSDKICIVSTTISLNIEVLIYRPNNDTINEYGIQNYELCFSDDRNNISKEYYEAFLENGRVSQNKTRSILSLLLSEYIIDEIAITGENPRIKMYENIDSYAQNITEYRIKYINRRTNKIELAYRPVDIKRLGANVSAGIISNDPYIKLDNLPESADFPLNRISCYWTHAYKNKKEEVAIYIANKQYENYNTYREYIQKNTQKYEELAENLKEQFQKEIGKEVDKSYIINVLSRLNHELLYPSMDIIRDCMENPVDPI